MKLFIRIVLSVLSLYIAESFVTLRPFPKHSFMKLKMCKHDFLNFAKDITVADKYFLIQSLINKIILHKPDLLHDYCYKNFNYTDIMHVVVSSDLEYIVKKHYDNKTTLELYDTIKKNAELTDCFLKIHRFNDTRLFLK